MFDEKKFQAIFQYAPLAIMYTDEKGVITTCNQRAVRLFGAPKEKLIGFSYAQIRDEAMKGAIGNALAGKESRFEGEYLTVTGGALTYMNANFSPAFSSRGVVSGVIGIFEDVRGRVLFDKREKGPVQDLCDSLSKTDCLSGVHTICASCKRIRDAKGNWDHLESYFRERYHAEFSHTVCPDCSRRLYPDLCIKQAV
jgi:PAS domain S-box-containing protein